MYCIPTAAPHLCVKLKVSDIRCVCVPYRVQLSVDPYGFNVSEQSAVSEQVSSLCSVRFWMCRDECSACQQYLIPAYVNDMHPVRETVDETVVPVVQVVVLLLRLHHEVYLQEVL